VGSKHRGRWRLLTLLLALTLLAAACGGNDDDGGSSDSAGGGSGSDLLNLSGELDAAGATFPDAFYQEAIEEFADQAPDVNVIYNAIGSGAGKEQFSQGLADVAGTDSLVKPGDGPAEGSFRYVPTVAAPITVSYNLSAVEDLQLSPTTLAGIFQGDITSWDDDAIASDNPDADLPSTDITVVHRSDGSGTTSNFTKYLDAAADNWQLGAGDTVEWPASTQGAEKNTGVAQLIDSSDGAIGYVDLSDAEATGLTYASIENKDGQFVQPTLEGAAAALEGAEVADDLSYNPLNAPGADAYPITSPTFLLLKTSYDSAKLELVRGFVGYVLGDGQGLAKDVNFAPLPDTLRQRALDQLDTLAG
jgi:phosphate transport system substrate-binding protein